MSMVVESETPLELELQIGMDEEIQKRFSNSDSMRVSVLKCDDDKSSNIASEEAKQCIGLIFYLKYMKYISYVIFIVSIIFVTPF